LKKGKLTRQRGQLKELLINWQRLDKKHKKQESKLRRLRENLKLLLKLKERKQKLLELPLKKDRGKKRLLSRKPGQEDKKLQDRHWLLRKPNMRKH